MYIHRNVSTLILGLSLFALATSSSAAPGMGMGGGGGGGGGGEDATYRVDIAVDVLGNSLEAFPWSGGGGKFMISGRQHNAGVLRNLVAIASTFPDGKGEFCFPGAGGTDFPLIDGLIKPGKKGRAEASFWFEANTFEQSKTLFYILHLTGDFLEP